MSENPYAAISPVEKADLIKEAGFDGVFLFYVDRIDEVVKIVRDRDLEIETIHLPFINCNHLWLDTDEGREYVELTKKGILAASRNKIKTVVFHISSKNNPPAYNELGLARLREILDLCEKLDVNFALENLRRLDYLDYIYANLKSDKLKFCFDSGHANAFTQNLLTFEYEKYQDKLVCVHLHDNDGVNDLHLIPFTGNIDFEFLGKKFKEINYQGPLTSEAIIRGDDKDLLQELIKIRRALEEIEKFRT